MKLFYLCVILSVSFSFAQQPEAVTVPFEIGKANFSPGDSIKITSVKGTSSKIESSGSYTINGSYVLTSHNEASLGAFVTTAGSGKTPTDPRQMSKIKKGKGVFSLKLTIHEKGYPHVSFYPADGGEAFGGVYFGQWDSINAN
jgi:hypothetical protein